MKRCLSLITLAICTLTAPHFASAQSAPLPAVVSQLPPHDGQHDFDFNIGTWKANVKRLKNPLTGSSTWIELQGTVTVRKIWGGRAQMDEVELDGPNGHFQMMTLFLYSPGSHQWSERFANSGDGDLSVPMIGEFKSGRGEFYSHEQYKDRYILARQIWSDITADSHRLEQSFSSDGGVTWEPNYVATLTR
ncbi:hypothetical protein [Solimicrobium silvestre]|uniref:DUF1579 domain-containing protein n=1 Tax=Solimicrobium silvestre TaxID=2099400 RepID=A0A2S9H0I0_9BURK|nr:hypothetical protein [Solimicrobium silvestre]PRC93494.1 hypothetical protein S2091_1881 [Solimicrobium silvestre]